MVKAGVAEVAVAVRDWVLLADGVELSTNIGALFRLADALGCSQLFFSGIEQAPKPRKLKKVSRDTEAHVAHQYGVDPLGVVAELREKGYRAVCLELSEHSIDIGTLKLARDEKLCLIVGSERRGISKSVLSAVEPHVHIAMQGNNHSMNVVMAAAIAAYTLTRC